MSRTEPLLVAGAPRLDNGAITAYSNTGSIDAVILAASPHMGKAVSRYSIRLNAAAPDPRTPMYSEEQAVWRSSTTTIPAAYARVDVLTPNGWTTLWELSPSSLPLLPPPRNTRDNGDLTTEEKRALHSTLHRLVTMHDQLVERM